MRENVELLKLQNPEFTYFLYDDNMCRDFIEKNFDTDVLYSFNKLKPGAYKADLWRYCILYKYGGIYLDIKFSCIHDFKLIELTDKEYFVRDLPHKGISGVYNALIVCLPNNNILYKSIYHIVNNVKNNIYGNNYLYITGPHLLLYYFNSIEIENMDLNLSEEINICIHNKPIIKSYNTYRIEQKTFNNLDHYGALYNNMDVYYYPILMSINTINISRTISKEILYENIIFYSNTPTIIELKDNVYIINLLWVDNKNRHYINSRYKANPSFEKIKDEVFLECHENNNIFIGLKDMNIFYYKNNYYYTATLLENESQYLCSNMYNIDDNVYKLEKNIILPNFYDKVNTNVLQNNCVFVDYSNNLCVIYDWFPLQIGKIDYANNSLDIIEIKYSIPNYFKNVKCNNCGYTKNNVIWFILYKITGTKYQHFFAIFDLNMNLIKYSELFKFSLDDAIEYCVGFIVKDTEIILTYNIGNNSIISIYDISYINSGIKWYYNY
jgi:hypothetical protein